YTERSMILLASQCLIKRYRIVPNKIIHRVSDLSVEECVVDPATMQWQSTVGRLVVALCHEFLMQWKNGVIKTGGEKEWGQSRAVPINPENSSTGQSQAVPTNPEHEADSDLSLERF
ncbi:hypothetical protein J6590_107457, partial [Homalodisca vitripennis]